MGKKAMGAIIQLKGIHCWERIICDERKDISDAHDCADNMPSWG